MKMEKRKISLLSNKQKIISLIFVGLMILEYQFLSFDYFTKVFPLTLFFYIIFVYVKVMPKRR